MFKTILKFLGCTKFLPDKDPSDHTLTESSKPWTSATACPKCNNWVTVRQNLDGICPHCGPTGRMFAITKYGRQIIKDGKWITQIKNE